MQHVKQINRIWRQFRKCFRHMIFANHSSQVKSPICDDFSLNLAVPLNSVSAVRWTFIFWKDTFRSRAGVTARYRSHDSLRKLWDHNRILANIKLLFSKKWVLFCLFPFRIVSGKILKFQSPIFPPLLYWAMWQLHHKGRFFNLAAGRREKWLCGRMRGGPMIFSMIF